MDETHTIGAVFSGPVKALANPQKLSLTKDPEGSGYGTVKGGGVICEALCTSETAVLYGPVEVPKVKAGAKVLLKATSAPGSGAVQWTGCETNPTPSECVLVIPNGPSTIGAKFDELE